MMYINNNFNLYYRLIFIYVFSLHITNTCKKCQKQLEWQSLKSLDDYNQLEKIQYASDCHWQLYEKKESPWWLTFFIIIISSYIFMFIFPLKTRNKRLNIRFFIFLFDYYFSAVKLLLKRVSFVLLRFKNKNHLKLQNSPWIKHVDTGIFGFLCIHDDCLVYFFFESTHSFNWFAELLYWLDIIGFIYLFLFILWFY